MSKSNLRYRVKQGANKYRVEMLLSKGVELPMIKQLPNNNKPPTRRGRKTESRNVQLCPVFLEEPNIEKLGRAIIAMAMRHTNVDATDKTWEKYDEEV